MKNFLLFAILLSPCLGLSTDEVKTTQTGTVSISAKGADVRSVLSDLFGQAKKNYVVEPHTYFALHLSLTGLEFEEALGIVCRLADLRYEVQNGIYFISKAKPAPVPKAVEKPTPQPVAKPKGTLPQTVLTKRVTTRLKMVDFKTLFAEVGRQTGIKFDINPSVPSYKIDAFLIDTSLKYTLDTVTEATKLKWRMTDDLSIEIFKPEPEQNRIVVHN